MESYIGPSSPGRNTIGDSDSTRYKESSRSQQWLTGQMVPRLKQSID